MSAEITMTASFGDSKTLDVLADLISKREKAMRYELTENAVISTAISVLTSIRARTKVAKKDTGGVIVAERGDLVPGFRSIGGGRRVVCVRSGRRGPVDVSHAYHCIPAKLSNMSRVYMVRDLATSSLKVKCDYYLIADSKAEAEKYAKERHERRVASHRGMAKWAIGIAQAKVSNRPAAMNETSNDAKQIATQNVRVAKQGSGYSSGRFSVDVNDLLRYAKLAMPGRDADLEMSLKKASNSTAAKIRKVYDLSFDGECPTPFPEVAGK